MKKVLLSLALLIVFGAYVYHQKTEGSESLPVVAPKTLSSTPEPSASGNPIDSPSSSDTSSISTPKPTASSTKSSAATGTYKDGVYTGISADAFYGNVQVRVTIASAKVANVEFLEYPNDRRTSIEINQQAIPYLKTEAIQAQNANVDVISGATQTSIAFKQSLESALQQAI